MAAMDDDTACPAWPAHFPFRVALRRDTEAMLTALTDALSAHFGPRVVDVFVKGSAVKPWRSPADYCPAVSDLDVHVLLDDAGPHGFASAEEALSAQAAAERAFFAAVPGPAHVPRPQVLFLDPTVLAAPDFVGSPPGSGRSLKGTKYPARIPEAAELRKIDAAALLLGAQVEAALQLNKVFARTGPHALIVLRELAWRVGPTPSRAVSVLGGDFALAWGSNRTRLLEELDARGEAGLAWEIREFYDRCWEFHLSGDRDGDAGRAAVLAGVRAMRAGAELASRLGHRTSP
ncbi:hypothetical protein DFJ74DRAFT_705378 [Hyaloraphidium curvatum]|nr:hypothetical protein DFJ74DRAFT_705378 [Hyaloraphidium curvatum]